MANIGQLCCQIICLARNSSNLAETFLPFFKISSSLSKIRLCLILISSSNLATLSIFPSNTLFIDSILRTVFYNVDKNYISSIRTDSSNNFFILFVPVLPQTDRKSQRATEREQIPETQTPLSQLLLHIMEHWGYRECWKEKY